LKEEARLTNFLFYGFLIKGLGAELLAPEDQRKFSKIKRPLDFWISAWILACRAGTTAGTVGERARALQPDQEEVSS
jgi:hypothetical protein